MKKKLNCVLLIDDDEPTNFIYRIVVEQSGCTDSIQIAQSGLEALDYLEKVGTDLQKDLRLKQPDLIFLDINMPRMDGWEFLEKYRELKLGNKENTIVIMLSTSINPDDEAKAKETPEIAGFRNKPLTNEVLEEILTEYFPGNR